MSSRRMSTQVKAFLAAESFYFSLLIFSLHYIGRILSKDFKICTLAIHSVNAFITGPVSCCLDSDH